MKTAKTSTTRISLLMFVMLFLANGCTDILNNPLKDKETGEDIALLLLDLNFFDTQFTFHFIDQVSGEYVDGTPIQVFFAGKSAGHIVDINGRKNESYQVTNGQLSVMLDPNVEVSASNPVEFMVFVDVEDFSFDAFPTEMYYTAKGDYDKVIDMFRLGDLPGKTTKAMQSPGLEPFDVKFNGSLILAENDPVWLHGSFISEQQDKLYYSIYRSRRVTPLGVLSSENFSGDPVVFSNWGLEGVYLYNNATHSFGLTNDNIPVPSGARLFKAYSAVQRSNMAHCASGIDIRVSNVSGETGSGRISYTLLADGEITARGRILLPLMPYTVNTGGFYYPADASVATIQFSGDAQYNVAPEQIEVPFSGLCGSRIDLVVSPKDNLTPHRFLVSFVCLDQSAVGMAPSIRGRYRIKGSSDPWTDFKFFEGTALLMLKSGETYEVVATVADSEVSYDIPTDPAKIDQVIKQALIDHPDSGINEIIYTIRHDPDGTVVVRGTVYFKTGRCPV